MMKVFKKLFSIICKSEDRIISNSNYDLLSEQHNYSSDWERDIEEELADLYPEENDVAPFDWEKAVTIVLNWFLKPKDPEECMPAYFYYEYGITNFYDLQNELLKQGYLATPSVRYILNKYKVTELKALLNEYRLDQTGKKAELIDRLADSLPITKINELRKKVKGYCTTEKGKEFIKQHSKYVFLHKHKDFFISLDEYDTVAEELGPGFSENDIAWSIFNRRILQYSATKQWGFLANNFYNMRTIAHKEGRERDALLYFIVILCCDLNGLGNGYSIPYKEIIVPSGIVYNIHKLKHLYSDDMLDYCYDRLKLPSRFFNKKALKQVLLDIFRDEDIDLSNYRS